MKEYTQLLNTAQPLLFTLPLGAAQEERGYYCTTKKTLLKCMVIRNLDSGYFPLKRHVVVNAT